MQSNRFDRNRLASPRQTSDSEATPPSDTDTATGGSLPMLRAESQLPSRPQGAAGTRQANEQQGFGRLRRNLTGLATLLFLAAAVDAQEDIEVHWRGDEHAATALPAELAPGASAAVTAWAAWAEDHGYRMDLTDDGRVLLLGEGRRLSSNTWKLLGRTLETYDELFPPLAALEATARDASVRTVEPDVRPEQTAVLVMVDSKADYRDLLAHLAQLEPYLADWARGAEGGVGFSLERPLVAAFQTKPDGVDEWDPDNELAHRLGTLLVSRDHGRMPHWLARGLAWAVEIEAEGDVACFPGRQSFVFAVEHGSWPRMAKNLARERYKDDAVVALDRLAGWARGTWDDDLAVLSWSVTRWLADERPGLLPVLLAELEAARVNGATTYYPDGSWETDGSFTLDADAQREIFARHLGDDFEAAWTAGIAGKRR